MFAVAPPAWWPALLGAYDVAAGRVWALVPLWMAVGPTVLRRLHARRRPAVTGL